MTPWEQKTHASKIVMDRLCDRNSPRSTKRAPSLSLTSNHRKTPNSIHPQPVPRHLPCRGEGRWRAAAVEAGAVLLQEGPQEGECGLLQTDAVRAAQRGGLSAGQRRSRRAMSGYTWELGN